MTHDERDTQSTQHRRDDPEQFQRTGSTMLFWILVAILAAIGLCVVISLLLVLIFGS